MKTRFLLIALILIMSAAMTANAGQTLKELTTPPADSADAERLRIWFGVEKRGGDRIDFNIVDSRGRPVRQLAQGKMPKGYHNFYWDKKDDSGRFVQPGTYYYNLKVGKKRTRKPLEVAYRIGERECRIVPREDSTRAGFDFELTADSLIISLEVFTRTGKLLETPIVDSLLDSGRHQFVWEPLRKYSNGLYKFVFKVNGVVREIPFKYSE